MKRETKNFIFGLLIRELEAEHIQANAIGNPLEIDYVKDLILASKDFVNCFDGSEKCSAKLIIEEKLFQLLNVEYDKYEG